MTNEQIEAVKKARVLRNRIVEIANGTPAQRVQGAAEAYRLAWESVTILDDAGVCSNCEGAGINYAVDGCRFCEVSQ